ncbi:MAG: sigma-70 family RNA polymerase sigma factor [Caldilineaceae bacterium]|nr:sigma-70 family RNA polymerase sigma factor [Caldilineaceae bacterium]
MAVKTDNWTAEDSATTSTLVRRCLQGSAEAWRDLVERYSRLVHAVPARYGLSSAEVDDVGQEVFLALAQNLHRIEDPERLPGWLVTTARRMTWRIVQQRKRESPGAEADLMDGETLAAEPVTVVRVPSMHDLLMGWERQRVLAVGMERLGDRCRDLLTLLFLDLSEPSYDSISVQLGLPKGSIGPTRNRCLEQLRSILEGLGFHEMDRP